MPGLESHVGPFRVERRDWLTANRRQELRNAGDRSLPPSPPRLLRPATSHKRKPKPHTQHYSTHSRDFSFLLVLVSPPLFGTINID